MADKFYNSIEVPFYDWSDKISQINFKPFFSSFYFGRQILIEKNFLFMIGQTMYHFYKMTHEINKLEIWNQVIEQIEQIHMNCSSFLSAILILDNSQHPELIDYVQKFALSCKDQKAVFKDLRSLFTSFK